MYGGDTRENTWQVERERPENRVEDRGFQETAEKVMEYCFVRSRWWDPPPRRAKTVPNIYVCLTFDN